MSGVRVGTRLDLLERLKVKIDQEIAVERRKLALNGPGPRPRFAVFEKPKRGRVAGSVVDAYAAAHQPTDGGEVE